MKKYKNELGQLHRTDGPAVENNFIKKTILFSPASASFDTFKNFEERGRYFNKLIKNYIK
mgnify:CR=1 FL=1